MPSPDGQRECTQCPAWVVRCAHWEGRILVLVDRQATPGDACGRCGAPREVTFGTAIFAGQWSPCEKCGAASVLYHQVLAIGSFRPDLPAAEAEFRRREAAMLGREES